VGCCLAGTVCREFFNTVVAALYVLLYSTPRGGAEPDAIPTHPPDRGGREPRFQLHTFCGISDAVAQHHVGDGTNNRYFLFSVSLSRACVHSNEPRTTLGK